MASAALQAVVLAGGRGTRMGALTTDRPKPLLEVAGRSLLQHQLAELAPHVARAVIVTGYRGGQIERAVDDWSAEMRLAAVRCVRQAEPLGTAHALLTALPALDPELPVLVLLGDLFVPWSSVGKLVACRELHDGGSHPVLAVNRVDDPWLGAAVHWRESDPAEPRVTRIVEKPPRGTSTTPWNNTGVYLLPVSAVARCGELERSPRGEYELPDLITLLMEDDDGGVLAQPIPTPLHVGRPGDLEQAERWFRERTSEVSP